MGLYLGRFRKIGYDNHFGRIGPEFYESKIMSSTNKHPKKENIENKVEKQGIDKEPDISTMLSTEGGTQNYCTN